MVVVDGQGIPLGIHVASARPAEVTLVDATLNTIREMTKTVYTLSVDCASTACTATLATCRKASRSEPEDAITPMPTETADT